MKSMYFIVEMTQIFPSKVYYLKCEVYNCQTVYLIVVISTIEIENYFFKPKF